MGRRDEIRSARATSGRLSRALNAGRGDPRDLRREGQRITENDLNREHFSVEDARLTLKTGQGITTTKRGLEVSTSKGVMLEEGKLKANLGMNMQFDGQGRIAVKAASKVEKIASPAGSAETKLNELIDALVRAGLLEGF